MEQRIKQAIVEMEASLERLKALLAWRDLRLAETRGSGRRLRLPDSTRMDLKIEAGRFWRLSVQASQTLSDANVAAGSPWRKPLERARQEYYRLTLTENFL